MSSDRLARAINDPERPAQLVMRTGIVRSVDTTGSPYTADLDLGGVTVEAVTFLAGHDLEAGATVKVLQQGPELLILGPLAPARMVVAEHNHATPPVNPASPPAPPAAPAAPAAVRTVAVEAVSSATWATQYGSDWRYDAVIAGGPTSQRGFWFYGGGIAAAKGAGTIVAATVFVKRASGGVDGLANVNVGTHGFASQPGSGAASLANEAVVGGLRKGQGGTFALTAAQVAALNAGAVGVGLEPGSTSYTSADYLIAEPRTAGSWSGVLQLTVEG